MRKLLIPILLLVTAGSFGQTQSSTPIEIVTVCDVITNRGSYNGKSLAVVGRWSPTDEGFWLADDCAVKVKTGDYVWSNLVSLEYDPSSPTALSKGFDPDKAVVLKKIAEMKARYKHPASKVKWAVVFGRIETREELQTVVAADGKFIMPDGYGHLNGSPAQLIYREKDLKVLPY